MTLDNFFEFIELQNTDKGAHAIVDLNPAHEIYAGHFVGQPIVPGVCQIYMINKALEKLSGRKLKLHTARNMKFFRIISPEEGKLVHLDMEFSDLSAEIIKVYAVVLVDEKNCMILLGEFKDL